MIVAERKPFDEIVKLLDGAGKVLVLGCRTCVAVCLAGGDREVAELVAELRMKAKIDGREVEFVERNIERQCEPEMVTPLDEAVAAADAVLSLGCGCGVQLVADTFPDARVLPGLNTTFVGSTVAEGQWAERCAMCGECILDTTGGICPIARCSKTLLNGPCGGSQDGKCEVNPDVECAWQLIYERLDRQGRLGELAQIVPMKDWSSSRDGGPRRVVREDARMGSSDDETKED